MSVGTLDFVDDAEELLVKNGESFILIFNHQDGIRIRSHLREDEIEGLKNWVKNGTWNELLELHLEDA